MYKNYVIFICLLVFSISGFSQTLLIKYNNITDKSEYYYVKKNQKVKKINELNATKGTTVQLQVADFNNYLYKVNVKSKFDKVSATDSATSFGGVMHLFNLLSGSSVLIPTLSQNKLNNGNTNGFANKNTNTKLLQYMNIINELEELDNLLYDESNKITKQVAEIEKINLVRMQFNDLLYNPQLTSSDIKKKTKETITDYLKCDSVTLNVVINRPKEVFLKFTNEMGDFESNLESFNSKSGIILASVAPDPELSKETVISEISQHKEYLGKYYQNLKTETSKLSENAYSGEVLKLYKDYVNVQSNAFNYNYSMATEDNGKLYLNMEVITKDTLSKAKDSNNIIKYKIFPVNLNGGMKIATGIGFAFISNFSGQKDYYLTNDSIIASSSSDKFTPSLAAMIHFYNKTNRNVKYGGNFGFAIPISSQNINLSFLLGFSAIFGKNDMLVLSGGIAGMKMKVLDRGLNIGDIFKDKTGQGIPTKYIYDMGCYVCVSVNVAGLNK